MCVILYFWKYKLKHQVKTPTPYRLPHKYLCDFIVQYRFYMPTEGGRKAGIPKQGYRPGFRYPVDETENPRYEQIWMIDPEFTDKDGKVIRDNTIELPVEGKARIRFVSERMRDMHKDYIKPGVKAFFAEGPIIVAECVVIEILPVMY